MITVKISGLSELQRKLEQLPRDVSRKLIRTTLRQVGAELAHRMAVAAPKKTGFLAEHFGVKVRIEKEDIAGSAFIGPQGKVYYPGRGDKTRGVATGKHAHKGGLVPVVSVARFLEFGTSRMSKHPFMTQAFEAYKETALAKIIESIREALARWTR